MTLGLTRLEPAAPSVDRSLVWTDEVKRGEMLRQVRGNGLLVPENIVWVPVINQGRVERILVLPGTAVQSNTVLIELSNPELTKAALNAQWAVKAAEAESANLKVQLETQRLNHLAQMASAEASFTNARLDKEVNEQLARDGLVPLLVLKQSTAKAEEWAKLLAIEKQRLEIFADAIAAQMAVQEAKVEQLRAELTLKQQQVESLNLRAGLDGVLQKLGDASTLQVGQQLPAGANVARVADPSRLKAEIKIYETQAKDVQLGQTAVVDTRNGTVPGRVSRIDPAVQSGTVTVDVVLEGPLPRGARPDLSVEGTIELERLADVLYVGKPVQGTADSTVGLFRLVVGGREAKRVPVKLGRSSVTTIEVLGGLEVGDRVILTDMSQYDAYDRVRLN